MRSSAIFILFLACLRTYGQDARPTRHVAYFENPPVLGNQWGFELQAKVFESAESGKIKICRFDSFNESPKQIDPVKLAEIIESVVVADFAPWNPKKEYLPTSFDGEKVTGPDYVSYKGKIYGTIKENRKKKPTDTAYWKLAVPNRSFESIIGLDYVSLPQGDTVLQYIHFLKKGMKYVVSFKASDVVKLLNADQTVWYPNTSNFANHVVGDLFRIYTNYDTWCFKDLWSQLDTVKLGIKKPGDDNLYLRTCVQIRGGRITNFVMGYGEHKFYGKVPISKIAKLIDGDRQEFWLKGDALANFKMFPLHKATSTTEFKILDVEKKSEPFLVEKLESYQEENFDFKDQPQENTFIDGMNKFLNLIFEGVAAGKLKAYKDESVQENYSANELVVAWARSPINEWKQNGYYEKEEAVLYKNEYYTSLASDNLESPENKEYWDRGRIEIVQPEFVRSILFKSRTTFDVKGNVLEKEYYTMRLERLGYFRFDEVRDYVQKADPSLFKDILRWMDDKGIFEVSPFSLMAGK